MKYAEVTPDPREEWAHKRRHKSEILSAAHQGRDAWALQGPEAKCPYPDADVRKRAWGMGYNAGRHGTRFDPVRIVRHFRETMELA